jgi:hypothetical protein
VVRVLLEEGKANANQRRTGGSSALSLAARWGQLDCVELLLCTSVDGVFFLNAQFSYSIATFQAVFANPTRMDCLSRTKRNAATVSVTEPNGNVRERVLSWQEIIEAVMSCRDTQLSEIRIHVPDFTEEGLCVMVYQFSCASFAEVLQIVYPSLL